MSTHIGFEFILKLLSEIYFQRGVEQIDAMFTGMATLVQQQGEMIGTVLESDSQMSYDVLRDIKCVLNRLHLMLFG